VSIGSIGNLAYSYSSTPLPIDANIDRRAAVADPSAVSYLTAGDRDLISAMFGPDVTVTGFDAHGKPVQPPKFVALLIADRKTGRLPAGVEVTSPYLQGIWDQHTNSSLFGGVSGPLTEKNLADGLAFLSQRSQGATVDIRA